MATRDEQEKPCPFCKELIKGDALKCRYCQSLLMDTSAPAKTEKLAELVIKSVGTIPVMMALLFAIAAVVGIKTISDVREYSKQARQYAESIKADEQIYQKVVVRTLAEQINSLVNDLNVDSNAPRAVTIRKDLTELIENIRRYKAADYDKNSGYRLAVALSYYYDKHYNEGINLLKQTEDSPSKFRILGILTAAKADDAEKKGRMSEAKSLSQDAYDDYKKAESLLTREEFRLLDKNRFDRADRAAVLGNFPEAEAIYKELHRKDPHDLLIYYNTATLYCRCGELKKSLDILDDGIKEGLISEHELSKKDLMEDMGFKNLRSSTLPEIKKRFDAILKMAG